MTRTMDVNVTSSRSLLGFLSRSRKKRTYSIDATVLSAAETDSDGELRQSRHMVARSTPSSRQSSFSRAASYIFRRQTKLPSSFFTTCRPHMTDTSLIEVERIDDRFSTRLNQCEPSRLVDLRQKRAEESPIVCYESDDNGKENEVNPALLSRWEALRVQQRLLGKDHPDVVFFQQHIGRYQHSSRLYLEASRNDGTPSYHAPRSVE